MGALSSASKIGLVALTSAVCAGCSGSHGYFPLEIGKTWTYQVRAGLAITVNDLTVVRRLAVAGTAGYEVGGPLGFSRLTWKAGTLLADSLPNTRFAPPMPMLVPGDSGTLREAEATRGGVRRRPVRTWQGSVEAMGKSQTARAELFQEESTVSLGTRKYPAIKATLKLYSSGKTLELATWYVDGMGPVRQDQQTNGFQDVGMEYLGGS